MIAAVLAVAAAATMPFNLVCTGEAANFDNFKRDNVGPLEITYRVDLHRGRYCSGECPATLPIAKITETEIYFILEERGPLDDSVVSVNRESGAYLNRFRFPKEPAGIMGLISTGRCERAPFTGFPERKF